MCNFLVLPILQCNRGLLRARAVLCRPGPESAARERKNGIPPLVFIKFSIVPSSVRHTFWSHSFEVRDVLFLFLCCDCVVAFLFVYIYEVVLCCRCLFPFRLKIIPPEVQF